MSRKSFLFAQLLALLLLISQSVVASPVGSRGEFHHQQQQGLYKDDAGLHKNMLQQQLVHVTAGVPEHTAKPFPSGFGILSLSHTHLLLLPSLFPTNLILQDVDRCESVSGLLFPYHIFW